ncbi:putative ribonuclease H-like domain-containing protein [Tanacetum coccineum]
MYSLTMVTSAVSSEAKNGGEKTNEDTGLKSNEEPVDQAHQIFLEELEKLKRQEQEANDAAEALRNQSTQDTEELLFQAGAAKASSTNTLNIVSTPVSTASPSKDFSAGGPTYPDLNNYADQDDSQIPTLEDIYHTPDNGIFTNASYDDEGVVTDFTNLETFVDILGDPKSAVQTRSKVDKGLAHALIEPKKISEALEEESWVDVMQEELLQFKLQKVRFWFDFAFEEESNCGQNGFTGIKKDERRIEAIRIFLAFASYMRFIVYQMDVKSTFFYDIIDEEVYVSQPPGFVDPKYPKKVYKVVKALYGLHQAPRAWYATLSTFLEKSEYRRGTIDKTLFIKKDKKDIMLVQVYVDDIIFGSTKKSWSDEFEALMKSRFQMSSMGELTFFL